LSRAAVLCLMMSGRVPVTQHSDIKQKVLRGVYEDNAGIPRSYHGKGRTKVAAGQRAELHAALMPASRPMVRSGSRAGFGGKAMLLVVLGVVALLGINFRLVMVDWAGPVAKQVVEDPSPQSLAITRSMLTSSGVDLILDGEWPNGPEPTLANGTDPVTTGHYDSMLARLDMPMADLFNLKVQTIVIDPGHGGIDPGATGHQGLKEKDVALDIALRLRDKLVESGHYRVLLTREDDRKMFLKERVAFAKKHRADLFISTHINALPAGANDLNYVETYYFGPHTDQQSLALAEKENHGSDYAMGEFREVISRIGDTLKTEESEQLANSIQKHLYRNLSRRNRDLLDAGSKAGPFMVLLGVEVPSVLVEVSCISNKAEETRLSKPEYRDSVADFLKAGIVEYLEQRTQQRTIVVR
jgi:N-acetylmuramoyl-L-alanine amidase